VAERRAVANQGRPQCSTLKAEGVRAVAVGGDILDAQRQVTWQRGGRWKTRGGVLDGRRRVMWQSGGCEGGCRPGEAFSRLDVE
jgi:hypothetical protein